jgi:hypothetical protein
LRHESIGKQLQVLLDFVIELGIGLVPTQETAQLCGERAQPRFLW